jgi:hypothetical protein
MQSLITQVDNQAIMDTNRTNKSQEMLNALDNLYPNQPTKKGRRARPGGARRASGVTDTDSPPTIQRFHL